MHYVREVFEVEDPSAMVAAVLRRRDLLQVATLIRCADLLDDPSEAKETLRVFMSGDSLDYDLLIELMTPAYWLYCGPRGERRANAPKDVRPVFKEFADDVIVAGSEESTEEVKAGDVTGERKVLH
jgi:hypothetical protein